MAVVYGLIIKFVESSILLSSRIKIALYLNDELVLERWTRRQNHFLLYWGIGSEDAFRVHF